MAIDLEPLTPLEQEQARRRRRRWLLVLFVLFIIGLYVYWRIVPQGPEEHTAITDHFKYGSIGADNADRGVPYWLWKVLPEMFPQYLPDGGRTGYASLGLIHEQGRDRPIGFSQRRVLGLELVGLNCAICHTGTYRETPDSERQIVLGMPANTVNLQGYFNFLFQCAADPGFLEDDVMERIKAKTTLDFYERLAYPRAIKAFRKAARQQKEILSYWKDIAWGPGRVDTFNPYIKLVLADCNLPIGDPIGMADFPSLWNQEPRSKANMNLHWDGNNSSVLERNISAAAGAGVRVRPPASLDEPSMDRIGQWIMTLPPPKCPPQHIRAELAEKGKKHYFEHRDQLSGKTCADCHDFAGSEVGHVTSIDKIGTDRHRLDSFTLELSQAMNTIGEGYPWHFQHFKKTDGYANVPLDGLWLRAPYLHNGSVPTLRQLLTEPNKRSQKPFYRGCDVYDWDNVGFKSDVAEENGHSFFKYDPSKPGNSNSGHHYGSDLSDQEKNELLEFLKTL